jgi:predicted Zn-dependent protease with MMP-like domain
VIHVDPERFEELVADALDSLPDALGRLLDNVAVFVEDHGPPGVLGLYTGIPLTDRGAYGALGTNGLPMPDRIAIYRRAILGVCADEDDVVTQVRITVIHEVGHHFGLSDARLHELGWG